MSKRSINMDVIRCVALFLVVGVHFFLNSNFYYVMTVGIKSYVLITIRNLFMVCVPLFMLLSGYLMKNKKFDKSYYKKIFRIIIIYVLASLFCLAFRIFYVGEVFTFRGVIKRILNFSLAPYSWYVEMYLGLFLIIPFINMIYEKLESRKRRKWAIFIFIFITILPNILNTFQFSLEWFKNPANFSDYIKLLPSWWCSLYPITYYLVGAYLRDYDINIKLSKKIIVFVFGTLLFGLYSYYRSYGHVFESGSYNSYNGIVFIFAVLLFDIIKSIKFSDKWSFFNKVISYISKVSFGAYLVSYIFDILVYRYFNNIDLPFRDKVYYAPLCVFIVLICSIVLSSVIQLIYDYGKKLLNYIYGRIKWKKKNLVLKKN